MNPQTWSSRCAVDGVATIQGFECLFANILQFVVVGAGLVFFVMFIIAGYQLLFASGDPKKAAAASATITHAAIGLIGAICSVLILKLLQQFTGINLTNFVIPGGPTSAL
ncbi:MAG TPA: hypothetical protein PK131_00365 [Candidatus Woesebacteria bacterium]|nr:hypothetical protein [Candidatus Woesebacteria bacterium]HRS22766.1 hypothetical protein [Candidatus Woesebacteria bacterium]HRT40080.1 hypothetical protein [Candidatus Woesebacteria bacterium]